MKDTTPIISMSPLSLERDKDKPQQTLVDIEKPNDNDVLCGRGVNTSKHVGNNKFRTLVSSNRQIYATSTKKGKMVISKSIVKAIRELDPPGRFLEKDKSNVNKDDGGIVRWYDVGDKKATEKTSQALRDAAAKLRKQLSNDMSDPNFFKAIFDNDDDDGLVAVNNNNNNNSATTVEDSNTEADYPMPMYDDNYADTEVSKRTKGHHHRTRSLPNQVFSFSSTVAESMPSTTTANDKDQVDLSSLNGCFGDDSNTDVTSTITPLSIEDTITDSYDELNNPEFIDTILKMEVDNANNINNDDYARTQPPPSPVLALSSFSKELMSQDTDGRHHQVPAGNGYYRHYYYHHDQRRYEQYYYHQNHYQYDYFGDHDTPSHRRIKSSPPTYHSAFETTFFPIQNHDDDDDGFIRSMDFSDVEDEIGDDDIMANCAECKKIEPDYYSRPYHERRQRKKGRHLQGSIHHRRVRSSPPKFTDMDFDYLMTMPEGQQEER